MLELININKTYKTKNGVTHRALIDVNLYFEATGLNFIVGKSGSGKSTLLNIIGGLDTPNSGDISILGNSLKMLSGEQADSYRNSLVGFIFQDFNLIDNLTIKENILLSLNLQKRKDDEYFNHIVERLGLQDYLNRLPFELSGGQKQRVAIARAMVKKPKILLVDEPTGSLDSASGKEIFDILVELSKEMLLIVVTHDRETAESLCDRMIEIADGEIVKDLFRTELEVEEKISTINSVVRIEKGYQLDENNLDSINKKLQNNYSDSFVVIENNENKVKAMSPYIMKAIAEYKTQATSFIAYKPNKDNEKKEIDIVKGKMPIKESVKLAYSNMKRRKLRLASIIFMLILSMLFMGFVSSFNNYDMISSQAKAMKKSQEKFVNIKSINGLLTEKKLNVIKENNNYVDFFKKFNVSQKIEGYNVEEENVFVKGEYVSPSDFKFFSGFIECDDISKLSLNMLHGAGTINAMNEIIISDYAAEHLLRGMDAYSTQSVADLIGTKIVINEISKTIVGVYDTGFDKIKPYLLRGLSLKNLYIFSLSTKEENMLGNYLDNSYSMYSYYITKDGGVESISKDLHPNSIYMDAENIYTQTCKPQMQVVEYLEVDNSVQDDKAIYLSKSVIANIYMGRLSHKDYSDNDIIAMAKEFNSNKKRVCFSTNINDQTVTVTLGEFKIKGIITSSENGVINDNDSVIVLNNTILDEYRKLAIQNFSLVSSFSDNYKQNKSLLNMGLEYDLELSNATINAYSGLNEMLSVMSTVISVINAVIIILIFILLMMFISNSVSRCNREIGTLRALGSSKYGVFKVFVWEAIIMVFSALIVATVILFILSAIINSVLSSIITVPIMFANIRFVSIVQMVLLTVAMAAVSLLLPFRKYLKMNIIDAIRSVKE